MTNVFIHVGTHKTGTTTIQHALREASRVGGSNGWHYAGTPRAAKGFMRSSIHDAECVRSFREEFLQGIQRAGGGKSIIFSSEALSGRPGTGYQNANAVASMLREATADYDVKIIIYLRRQDDFVESMYTQSIHQGESVAFEDFLAGFDAPGALMYSLFINNFIEHFGRDNIIVRSYHTAAWKGLLEDFGDLVGATGLSKVDHERKNPSYSSHALEIAKKSNLDLDAGQKRQLRDALQKVMYKNKGERFSLFSNAGREAFLERFAADNHWVAEQYLLGDVETAFPPVSAQDTSPEQTPLCYNQVSRLVVELLQQSESRRVEKGFLSGVRVVLSGYPRLARLVRMVFTRE